MSTPTTSRADIADLTNLGKAEAGHISAGKFLERFAEGYPWVHLDIAGPAFLTAPDCYRGKGGTGTGVRLTVRVPEEPDLTGVTVGKAVSDKFAIVLQICPTLLF